MVRRCVDTAIMVLMVALAACSKERGTYRGVVVVNRNNARRLNAEWVTRRARPDTTTADPLGSLLLPLDLSIGPGDSVYVADGRANQIVVYDPSGRPVRAVGRLGQGPGEFERLSSVVVDEHSRIWARDASRVQLLSSSGACIATTEIPWRGGDNQASALPGGIYWTGDLAGVQGLRLSADSAKSELVPLNTLIRESSTNRSKHALPYDLISYVTPTADGRLAVLMPYVSKRKQGVWFRMYDQRGGLLAEYDVEPAFEDASSVIPPATMNDDICQLYFSGMCARRDGGVLLLASSWALICPFLPDSGSFGSGFEIWLRPEGSSEERLLTATDFEVDSRGRVAICGFDASGAPLVLRTESMWRADAVCAE